jgi:hypothetical protein
LFFNPFHWSDGLTSSQIFYNWQMVQPNRAMAEHYKS